MKRPRSLFYSVLTSPKRRCTRRFNLLLATIIFVITAISDMGIRIKIVPRTPQEAKNHLLPYEIPSFQIFGSHIFEINKAKARPPIIS